MAMTDEELFQVTADEVKNLSDEDFLRLSKIYDEDDDVYNEIMRRGIRNMGKLAQKRSQAMADAMLEEVGIDPDDITSGKISIYEAAEMCEAYYNGQNSEDDAEAIDNANL